MRKFINALSFAVILTGSIYLTTAPVAVASSSSGPIIAECECSRSSCSGTSCRCRWHGGCYAEVEQ